MDYYVTLIHTRQFLHNTKIFTIFYIILCIQSIKNLQCRMTVVIGRDEWIWECLREMERWSWGQWSWTERQWLDSSHAEWTGSESRHEVEHGLWTWEWELCRKRVSWSVNWKYANRGSLLCPTYHPLSSLCVLAVVVVSCAISTDPTSPVTLIPLLANTSTVA